MRISRPPFLPSAVACAVLASGSLLPVTAANLGPSFPRGMFVAMSTDKTFHFCGWEDLAGAGRKVVPVTPRARP